MAESLAHKFGQIIGEVLELAIYPHLNKFANDNKLFVDRKGKRNTRKGIKVTWTDINGNKHDLDFVLEKGGDENTIGTPVAFIESAWRRGSRHSKNKVQEIAAAINPVVKKYSSTICFKGAILAGDFTKPSLAQLESDGFVVLYFPTESVVKTFAKFGIDVLTDDQTAESDYAERIKKWAALEHKEKLATMLLEDNKDQVARFFDLLSYSVTCWIERVIILPLHGEEAIADSVKEAIQFIKGHSSVKPNLPFVKYEVIIRYNTGEKIEGTFNDKTSCIRFLEAFV